MQNKNVIGIIKPGWWQTEGGGKLFLEIAGDGLVKGSYATTHGRPTPEETFPVTGWVNHDLIGLTCSWRHYRSMTTWCGRYYQENGQDTLQYMWHLAREFADREQTETNPLTFTFHTMSGTFYYQGP